MSAKAKHIEVSFLHIALSFLLSSNLFCSLVLQLFVGILPSNCFDVAREKEASFHVENKRGHKILGWHVLIAMIPLLNFNVIKRVYVRWNKVLVIL